MICGSRCIFALLALVEAGLAIGVPNAALARNDAPIIEAEAGGIAAGGDITNNLISQTIYQQDPALLAAIVKVFADRNDQTTEARVKAELEAASLAEKLNFRTAAVISFFQTLGEENVSVDEIPAKLIEIASQAVVTRQRLALLDSDDPRIKALLGQAKAELGRGHSDAASALLQRSEEADLAAAALAGALAQQASAAASDRHLRASRARETRGNIALTQLRYDEAARHYREAATLLLDRSSSADMRRLLWQQAEALMRQGEERGDNTALRQSSDLWRSMISRYASVGDLRNLAGMQHNLGNALATLGWRESGTALLEQAIAAYRAALEENTRERFPLRWALSQFMLGEALRTLSAKLSDRESKIALLDQSATAYRASLEERPRARDPLAWASTQIGLGSALVMLSDIEGGNTPSLLRQAIAAYSLALEEMTRERRPFAWARTQTNLGVALGILGGGESGTALLEHAIAAHRAALKEIKRERFPLDWATVQRNLGNALQRLGERTGGTVLLEQAVTAYRAALEEATRERAQFDWMMTQAHLSVALDTQGRLEGGTARLEDAAAASDSCVQLAAVAGYLEWERFCRSRRDLVRAEIAQRLLQ